MMFAHLLLVAIVVVVFVVAVLVDFELQSQNLG